MPGCVLSRRRLRQLVVVDADDATHVVGVVTMSAITSLLRPSRSLSQAKSPQLTLDYPEVSDAADSSRHVGAAPNDEAEKTFATSERPDP